MQMLTRKADRAETRSVSIAAPPAAVLAQQMATVEDELEAVRALCEAEAGRTS
jgi:hypothetical protein